MLRALSGIEGEFEGENVAGSSLRSGRRRMTGSAFARYELRGTFHIYCSARLADRGGVRGGERGGIEPPSGRRRMTGSAFARYERRGTFHVL